MKKSKIFATTLAAVAALSATTLGLVACGGGDNTGNGDGTNTGNTTKHTVTFDYQLTGMKNSSVKVDDGDTVEKPANPTASMHAIEGWYTDAACTTEFDFETAIESDTTVYARWGSTYIFEAEYTDLTGLKGKGYSNEAMGIDLIVPDGAGSIGMEGLAKASNGFFVSYFYVNGLTLTFEINSDVEVTDAKLSMRLSGELIPTITLTDEEWLVKVNDEKMEYGSITIDNIDTKMGKMHEREFQDFVVTTNLHLVAGKNTITLTVNNNKKMQGAIGCTAPFIDCIKIDTTAKLTWDPELDNLEKYEE